MALSRAEELLFSHLSILVPLFAPFAALESLFMTMFPIDPATPFRVFPRAGEYPDCPAGVPHLLALLVIMRIPQAVMRRSRAGGEEEEEEEEEAEGGSLAVRPRMRRVCRQSLVIAAVLLCVMCYNAAVDELLREPDRPMMACSKMLVAAMMM